MEVELSHPRTKRKAELSNKDRTTFRGLPADIVLEILYILDIPSILRLRRTCTRICDISRSYTVWLTAFKHSIRTLPFKYYLDRPLQHFSAQLMEGMTVNMMKLDANWTSDHPKPTRIRELPGAHAASHISGLLPGGRWLLTALRDGSGHILAYDLDNPTMNAWTLAQLNDPDDRQPPIRLTVSIHGDEDFMMFDLAVMYDTREASTLPVRVSIWRITVDPELEASPLKSTHLKSLYIHRFGAPRTISVRDELLMRASGHLTNFEMRFDVFQWKQCSLTYHRKASFMTADLKRVYGGSHLLPNNRILCILQSSLLIYDIPEMSDMKNTEDTATLPVAQPRWMLDLDRPQSPILAISPPGPWYHTLLEHTSVTLANVGRLYIVLIPANGGLPPHIEHVINHETRGYMRKTMSVGHYRGVWLYNFCTVGVALTFSARNIPRTTKGHMWQSRLPCKSQCLERVLAIAENVVQYPPLFDEQSGRMVFSVKREAGRVINLVADFV